jgi:hypothetical protein
MERYSRSRAVTRRGACGWAHRGWRRVRGCIADAGRTRLDDLDFWADKSAAVYRPRWTLDELAAFRNFTRLDRRLVLRFEERPSSVRIHCRNLDSGK